MENGVAPSVITARSAMWNSGRLASISATVSPRRTPSLSSPPASASTRSRSALQDSDPVRVALDRLPEGLRDGGWGRHETTLPQLEAFSRQSPDVVGEADQEQR